MALARSLAGGLAGNLAGDLAGGSSAPSPFLTAYALWNIDAYTTSPRPHIPNAKSATPVSASLFPPGRNFFNQTSFWAPASSTVVDGAAAGPDGSTSASSVNGGAAWFLHPYFGFTGHAAPAGTYTLACNVKRNTGSDQQFSFIHSATRSSARTATSSWQRFAYTFTLGSPLSIQSIGIGSIDGATAANVLVCDLELFAGSSDLGPAVPAGHLLLGLSGYDTRPSYAAGALDMSNNGVGIVPLGASKTFTTWACQALVSRVAAGSAFSPMLAKPTSAWTTFGMLTERDNRPSSYFAAGGEITSPLQGTGLWRSTGKGYHVVTVTYDGTTFEYWLDDVRMLTNTVARLPVSMDDLTFNFVQAPQYYSGNKYAGTLAIWDRGLTSSEILATVAAQQARAAASSITASTTTRVLVAEGDSITTDSPASSYAYQYGPNASPSLYGVVYATGGAWISTLTARAATVDAILPANRSGRRFILSVLIGANDLVTLGTSAWLTALAAYCDARRAAGWYVVLCTVLPKGSNPTHNGLRATVNTAIRSTWIGVHCDAVCDFDTEATMGLDATASNVTYYSDGTHPTAAGHALLEAIYRPVINGIAA